MINAQFGKMWCIRIEHLLNPSSHSDLSMPFPKKPSRKQESGWEFQFARVHVHKENLVLYHLNLVYGTRVDRQAYALISGFGALLLGMLSKWRRLKTWVELFGLEFASNSRV